MLRKGDVRAGLYLLQNKVNEVHAHIISAERSCQRLGHPSNNKIKLLDKVLACNKTSKASMFYPCFVCPLVKYKRFPFVSAKNM